MPVADFEESLLKYSEFLMPFAFTLTHDKEQAKDLYQETITRALFNKEKYNLGTNIKAWLYTIMRNVFINHYRKKNRLGITTIDTTNDFFTNVSTTITSNTAITTIGHKEIETHIYKLPEVFKHPFILHFNGYKYTEISTILCEPLGTIKSRIFFARKILREQIERF